MSVKRITYVRCDICGHSLKIEDCSIQVAKTIARNRGFSIGNKDMCSVCKVKGQKQNSEV